VSPREAEEISGLSHTTIHEMVKSGRLASTKVGKRRLISYASLEKLLSGDGATPLEAA